eukprot:CAMPEP_0172317642 /NCGR_PEP_ID=MMETSP1058-20130122/32286_1 /TAXON_ID=83371 /ORGANISM="Detonula confervacea, Strain CCMP 353" /LENGTH=298 /DNA_ID=CAMNT_0013032255 /DNA_START=34 /DNA_END=930 /DNA_ORIENTATION=+
MAFYQRASKLAFMPAGGVAAAASTSILLGRYTTSTTNQKMNQVATHNLTTITNNTSTAFLRTGYQRNFASSSLLKELKGASGTINTAKGGKGFVQWYEGHLNSRPVITKAITGSILWGVGDFVAQVIPIFFEKDTDSDGDESTAATKKEFKYDFLRSARAVIFGFAIHAPLSHLHFNFLEWMTVRGGFQGLSIPVFKTIMEQFIYWSWISNTLYHGAMGAMQGMNLTQMYDRVADVLWDTQKAQWSFWIPIQLLNFQFVPVRHQLNVVLLTSIAWTALLSAWYPPEENKVEGEKKREE